MTIDVKNFIETNWQLLEDNAVEFFHSAHNGLSLHCQKELIDVLQTAKIDVEKERETTIHFIITMWMEDLARPIFLSTFISRYLDGILGYDADWLNDYIINNQTEWEDKVTIEIANQGDFLLYPKEV